MGGRGRVGCRCVTVTGLCIVPGISRRGRYKDIKPDY